MTMRFRSKVIVFVCSGFVLGAAQTARAQCDETLGPGANIATAVSNAPAGTTICLNSGNYGTVEIDNAQRSAFVTLSSAPGARATMTLTLSDSSYIRLQRLTFNWSAVNGSNFHHIEYVDSTFLPDGNGLVFNTESDSPPSTHQALRVDRCVFTNVGIALWDGRLNVRGVRGLRITNSLFSGSSNDGEKSDGIMLIGGSREVEIGPGNEFHSFSQANARQGEHVDAIQIYGAGSDNKILGNYFHHSDVFIMASDGSNTVTVENNIFDTSALPAQIKFRSAKGLTFRHNTVFGRLTAPILEAPEPGGSGTSDALVENNIFAGGASLDVVDCSGCTISNNMFSSGGTGTNVIRGTPTFVGGATPTTERGFALASGSVGENAGSDGKDVGTLYYGSSGPVPSDPPPTPDPDPTPNPDPDPDPDPDPTPNPTRPAPPTGLRVIR